MVVARPSCPVHVHAICVHGQNLVVITAEPGPGLDIEQWLKLSSLVAGNFNQQVSGFDPHGLCAGCSSRLICTRNLDRTVAALCERGALSEGFLEGHESGVYRPRTYWAIHKQSMSTWATANIRELLLRRYTPHPTFTAGAQHQVLGIFLWPVS